MKKIEYENLASEIVDSAFEVHKNMGPGLLESVYEQCLCEEIQSRNIAIKSQVSLPLFYKGIQLEKNFRIDVLVKDKIIIEVKSIDAIHPLHEAQIISYLKLSNCHLGFLINFNTPLIKNGI